jgi:hypothetical protein
MLRRRARGEPKAIVELEKEVAASSRPLRWRGSEPSLVFTPLGLKAAYALAALLVSLFAWGIHSPENLFWPAVGFLLIWGLVVGVMTTL